MFVLLSDIGLTRQTSTTLRRHSHGNTTKNGLQFGSRSFGCPSFLFTAASSLNLFLLCLGFCMTFFALPFVSIWNVSLE